MGFDPIFGRSEWPGRPKAHSRRSCEGGVVFRVRHDLRASEKLTRG